jgi:galactokinase
VGYAPGRVNLLGEHTDYNGGLVLPIAIGDYCAVAAGPGLAGPTRLASDDLPDELAFDVRTGLSPPPGRRRGKSMDYMKGVLAHYRNLAPRAGNLNLMAAGDVLIGAGLSSSAAVEVATACVLERAWGIEVEPRERALICQRAEHEFAGVPCGFMDQFAAVFGRADHALLIDCRSMDVEEVPLGSADDVAVLVVNSMVRHRLSDGDYGAKRRACERAAAALGVEQLRDADGEMLERCSARLGVQEQRCARHVVGENERVQRGGALLRAGRYAEFGKLMSSSHASLRDDFGVSCEELDVLVAAAECQEGVYGAKMTGAGFGGSIAVLVRAGAAEEVGGRVGEAYRARLGRSCGVLRVWAAGGCGSGLLSR